MPEVRSHRCADIGWQGKGGLISAFASDAHLAGVPVDVIELKMHHFARPESQAGEYQHEGVIAPAHRSPPIDGSQQLSHRVDGNRSRNRRHRPAGHGGYGGG